MLCQSLGNFLGELHALFKTGGSIVSNVCNITNIHKAYFNSRESKPRLPLFVNGNTRHEALIKAARLRFPAVALAMPTGTRRITI